MKKKKLQIEELKVKSFVTVVNKEEQRTTKGGYVHKQGVASIAHVVGDTAGGSYWTSEKTRATNADNVLAKLGGTSKTNG